MAIEFCIQRPQKPTDCYSIGDQEFKDEDPKVISDKEAQLIREKVAGLSWWGEIASRRVSSSVITIQVGEAKKTLEALLRQAETKEEITGRIQTLFGNEEATGNFLRMAKAASVTKDQLRSFEETLGRIKGFMGASQFAALLKSSFSGKPDAIFYFQRANLFDGGKYENSDAYHGFLLDTNATPAMYMNALFYKGGGHYKEIGAPYTACSPIVEHHETDDVLQQLVFDIPFPFPNAMTQNRTRVVPEGGFGKKLTYELEKSKTAPWKCLETDEKGTTFHYNRGYHLALQIGVGANGKPIVIYSYGTESDVEGADATDGYAGEALRNNMTAFYKAAHTEKWGSPQP